MIAKILIFIGGVVFGELATVMIMAICKASEDKEK